MKNFSLTHSRYRNTRYSQRRRRGKAPKKKRKEAALYLGKRIKLTYSLFKGGKKERRDVIYGEATNPRLRESKTRGKPATSRGTPQVGKKETEKRISGGVIKEKKKKRQSPACVGEGRTQTGVRLFS